MRPTPDSSIEIKSKQRYFQDLDGHLREIAWNSQWEVKE